MDQICWIPFYNIWIIFCLLKSSFPLICWNPKQQNLCFSASPLLTSLRVSETMISGLMRPAKCLFETHALMTHDLVDLRNLRNWEIQDLWAFKLIVNYFVVALILLIDSKVAVVGVDVDANYDSTLFDGYIVFQGFS